MMNPIVGNCWIESDLDLMSSSSGEPKPHASGLGSRQCEWHPIRQLAVGSWSNSLLELLWKYFIILMLSRVILTISRFMDWAMVTHNKYKA
jgi:hypothetical protein